MRAFIIAAMLAASVASAAAGDGPDLNYYNPNASSNYGSSPPAGGWNYAAMVSECGQIKGTRGNHCRNLVHTVQYRMETLTSDYQALKKAEKRGDHASVGLMGIMVRDGSVFLEHDVNGLMTAFPEVWAKR